MISHFFEKELILKKISSIIFIIIIILSCSKSEKKDGFIKTQTENTYKIDYQFLNTYVPTENVIFSFDSLCSTLYPFHSSNETESFLKSSIYSTLFFINSETGFPEKNLIKNFSITESNTRYNFNIYDDIRFSDGSILLTDDIISSFSLIKTILKNTVYSKEFFIENNEIKFEKISNYEFSAILDKPNGNFLYALTYFPILKKNVDASNDDIEKLIKKWVDIKNIPVGTGPYYLDTLSDRKIILKRNPYYFKKDKSGIALPYSDNITINTYDKKNEKKMMIEDFINGKSDIMKLDDFDMKNLSDYYKNNNAEKTKFIDTGTGNNMTFIVYNCYNKNNNIMENSSVRDYLSSIFTSVIKNDETLRLMGRSRKNDKKRLNESELNIKDKILDIVIPEEDQAISNLASRFISALNNEKIKTNLDILPYHKYLEKIFISKDYDIAIINYVFDPGILNCYLFIKNEKYGFSPFVNDNELTINKVNSLLSGYLSTTDFTRQKKIKDEIFDNLNDNFQFYPVFSKGKYFIIQSGIRNFKMNSSFQNEINLQTIEFVEKRKIKD
jgi:MarR-like DNA-binding transcriptional regulator SgrR of sgrS sRNA